MKRIKSPLFVITVVLFLGMVALFSASFLLTPSQGFFAFGRDRYLLVHRGQISLFSELDNSTDPLPHVFAANAVTEPRIIHHADFKMPGVLYRSSSLADGFTEWVFSFSMLFPMALLLVIAALLKYRLRLAPTSEHRPISPNDSVERTWASPAALGQFGGWWRLAPRRSR